MSLFDDDLEEPSLDERLPQTLQFSIQFYHRDACGDGGDSALPASLEQAASRILLHDFERQSAALFRALGDTCESPIEAAFAHAFILMAYLYRLPVRVECGEASFTLSPLQGGNALPVCLRLQQPIEKYRADFVIEYGSSKVVVECDGEKWHTSPHAVRRDKRKDRALQQLGYAVLRYVGAELLTNPAKSAYEVIHYLISRQGYQWS